MKKAIIVLILLVKPHVLSGAHLSAGSQNTKDAKSSERVLSNKQVEDHLFNFWQNYLLYNDTPQAAKNLKNSAQFVNEIQGANGVSTERFVTMSQTQYARALKALNQKLSADKAEQDALELVGKRSKALDKWASSDETVKSYIFTAYFVQSTYEPQECIRTHVASIERRIERLWNKIKNYGVHISTLLDALSGFVYRVPANVVSQYRIALGSAIMVLYKTHEQLEDLSNDVITIIDTRIIPDYEPREPETEAVKKERELIQTTKLEIGGFIKERAAGRTVSGSSPIAAYLNAASTLTDKDNTALQSLLGLQNVNGLYDSLRGIEMAIKVLFYIGLPWDLDAKSKEAYKEQYANDLEAKIVIWLKKFTQDIGLLMRTLNVIKIEPAEVMPASSPRAAVPATSQSKMSNTSKKK